MNIAIMTLMNIIFEVSRSIIRSNPRSNYRWYQEMRMRNTKTQF